MRKTNNDESALPMCRYSEEQWNTLKKLQPEALVVEPNGGHFDEVGVISFCQTM